MNTSALAAASLLSLATVLSAAPAADNLSFPKNQARQHLGANLFVFKPDGASFVPVEAGAAWLDDDIATGWPAAIGHNYYMIALSSPELLNNFALSARDSVGTINIYAGDEAAPPSAKSWAPLARNVDIASVNNKKLTQSFSRFAKYILIETNLTESGPWYSVYLYGEKSATSYSLEPRSAPINAHSLYKFVNDQTSISLAGLYAHSRVAYINSGEATVAMQQAIDDNPESALTLNSTSDKEASMVVRLGGNQVMERVSAMVAPGTKGRLDFYVAPAGNMASDTQRSQYIRAAYDTETSQTPTSVDGLTPIASIPFDGTNPRGSSDFSAQNGTYLLVKWTPEVEGQTVSLHELNTFGGDVGVSNFALVAPLEAIAEASGDYDASKDGKTALEGKEALPPVGEYSPSKTPFAPGSPPFPPVITVSF